MNLHKLFTFLLFFGLLHTTFAQPSTEDYGGYDIRAENYKYDQELHDYYKAMQLYILDKSAEPMPAALKQMISTAQDDGVHFTKKSTVHFIREYWTMEYVKTFPQPSNQNSISRDLPTICDNGGFEDDFTGYERYKSLIETHIPKCEPLDINDDPVDWMYLNKIPSTYPNDYPFDFKIMSPGLDPNIDPGYTIEQVLFGNKSLKINENQHSPTDECGWGLNGINKITKEFIVTPSTEMFAVWFATLLQDPTTHLNQKPFFNIRFYDNNNILIDELCWDSTEDFFEKIPSSLQTCETYASDLRLQPWKCEVFDFSGYSGQNLRMEITTADCGQGAHFGYAYVDGICEQCAQINISGRAELCEGYTVCGTYTTYDTGGTELELDTLWAKLYFPFNNEINFPITDIDYDSQSFCLTIPFEYFSLNRCYDVRVFGIFSDGINNPLTVGSASVIPGPYNDFCGKDIIGDEPISYLVDLTCHDVGDPRDITNDQFSFDISVSTQTTNLYYWEVLMDGVSFLTFGNGTQTRSVGPFNYQDCHFFELYVPELDKSYPIEIEYECDGCINSFRVCEMQIDCETNGSLNPNNHTWSVTFEVEGPDGGQWFADNGLSGMYNTLYSFDMGGLTSYNGSHTFEFTDQETGCYLFYTIEVPERCTECDLDYEIIIDGCKENPCALTCFPDPLYQVLVQVPGGLSSCKAGFCWLLNPGDCLPIDILSYNNGIFDLGIYSVNNGPWTLRIIDCDGCYEDVVIWPPKCPDPKDPININPINFNAPLTDEMEDNFLFVPNPTNGNLEIIVKDIIVENVDIEIYSIYGKEMMSINKEMHNLSLDIQSLPTGVYHAVISTNGKILTTEKIIKI